jgi:hypothetical protein
MVCRKYKNFGTAFALLITFLVCGAWHGLSWGFIVWGVMHGMYMGISVYYKRTQRYIYQKIRLEKSKLKHCWQIFFTFNLVSFSWIFFRSKSLSEAYYVVTHLFSNFAHAFSNMWNVEAFKYNVVFNQSRREFLVAMMGIMIITLVHKIRTWRNYRAIDDFLHATPYWVKWSAYYSLILIVTMFLYDTQEAFIYFKF